MTDDLPSQPPGPGAARPASPLPYAAPGTHERSQWITDAHPGGGFLVGCLVVLSVVGVVGGALVGLLAYVVGWW